MRDNDLDELIYAMYYSGVMSMKLHPGHSKVGAPGQLQDVVDNAAWIADTMFKRHVARFREK